MNNDYLIELIKNQNKSNDVENKIFLKEMQRIAYNIENSIFDKNKCSIWNGTKTSKKNNKGYTINFYYNNKKISLQRILYSNYIGKLEKNEYLTFTCKSNGLCCNINHLKKKNNNKIINTKINNMKKVPSNNNLTITEDNNKLKIIFN